MIINFLDTKTYHNIISYKVVENKKLNDEEYDILENGKDYFKSKSETEQLQSSVLNSLRYASSQNVLPSTLPEHLNVKFLSASTWDKLRDRFLDSPIAQLEDPNTLYVSTKLLPQHQHNSKNTLISQLYDKFKNPQQVLDLVVFHELGHLIFNNSFSKLTQFNQEILDTKTLLEKFKDKYFKENYQSIPLYQMNRSLEEHFADSYSSIILSKRYGETHQDYIDIRTGTDLDGLTRTQGFNININRLTDNFKQLSKLDYERDGIDTVIKQLYDISLTGSKEVMTNKLRIVRNDDLLNKLQSNLKSLGIETENNKKDILDKTEEVIKSKAENGEVKGLSNKRMFDIHSVEDRLKFFENKFGKVDGLSDSNKLKK